MKRNIHKQAELGKKIMENHALSNLKGDEIVEMYKEFEALAIEKNEFDAFWHKVVDAFMMGVAVGTNCEKKRSKA